MNIGRLPKSHFLQCTSKNTITAHKVRQLTLKFKRSRAILGSLRNHDDDGNKDVTNLHIWLSETIVAHALHVQFSFLTFRRRSRSFCDVKWPVLQLCGRRDHMMTNVKFCLLIYEAALPFTLCETCVTWPGKYLLPMSVKVLFNYFSFLHTNELKLLLSSLCTWDHLPSYRSFSLSRNKKINRKPSSGKSWEILMS